MNREDELKKLWQKCLDKDREVREELVVCKKQGRRTERYDNLLRDQYKLKEEYEKARGGKPYDPHNLQDVESAAERTARTFLGPKKEG